MANPGIVAITMPKWGLSMQEGKVVEWLVSEGTELAFGDKVVDIETEKIANTFEALDAGLLRRQVAQPDDVLPVGALLGVLAPASINDDDVDAFITEFQANYVPPAPAEGESGPTFQWAEVGSTKLRYSKLGETGPAVILIHGFGGDLGNWLFTQEPLAASAQVYALDLPGHGQSSKAFSDGSLVGLAQLLVGFMDAVNIPVAHLVGHSLGGALAMQVAIAAPSRVQSLTLLGPAGLGGDINGGYLSGFISGESRRDMKPLLQKLVANPELITRQLIDDILKFKRTDGVADALTAIAKGFVNGNQQLHNFREQLAVVKVPVQVVWGKDDKIVPAAHAQGLPSNVKVELIDGVGHLVHMEASNHVNATIKRVF